MGTSIQTGITPTRNSIEAGGEALAFAYSDAQILLIRADDHAAFMAFSEPALQSTFTRMKIAPAGDSHGEGPYVLTIPLPLKAQSGILYFCSTNATQTGFVTLTAIGCGNENY